MATSTTAVEDRVDELVGAFNEALVSTNTSQLRLLGALAELEREHVWEKDGHASMAEWVAAHVGISQWSARRWLVAGRMLPLLPHISSAFEAGELCLEKVLNLCRFATAETEADLVKWAMRVTSNTVRERAEAENKRSLEEVKEAHDKRRVSYWWTEQRTMLWLEAYLPAEQGAVVAQALDRVAGRLPDIVDDDEDEPEAMDFAESLDRRRADALVALASARLAQDADADAALVVVHVDADTLGGGHKQAEIELGGVLHPETVQRLCCDGRIQTVLEDQDGTAVGIGRAARKVPRWLLRQLRKRDRTCTFPGCERRWFLQAHHIRWWTRGGPTDLDNLALTCHHHHRLVHEGRWGVALEKTGVAWYRPNGKRYEPGAKQLELVERAPPEESAA